jgi:hypothetical protein
MKRGFNLLLQAVECIRAADEAWLVMPAEPGLAAPSAISALHYPCRKRRSASRLSRSACLVTRAFVAR